MENRRALIRPDEETAPIAGAMNGYAIGVNRFELEAERLGRIGPRELKR